MVTVKRYSSPLAKAWNSFLPEAKNATFLFHRDFMEYHTDRFEDHSLTLWEGEHLVGLLPANQVENQVHSHQGLSYGGLVVKGDAKFPLIHACMQAALAFLHAEGIESLHYKKPPRFYHIQGSDEVDQLFYWLEAKLTRRDTALAIPLAEPLPYQTRRQRAITQAKKKNVVVEEAHGLVGFWEKVLTSNLQARHGVDPVHTAEEIMQLKRKFPKEIRQFNAYLGVDLVAGTTIFETPTVAHAQYIGSTPAGRESGALDALFHKLLTQVYPQKQFFDFGIVNEEAGQKMNRGLLDWKEGFGGRAFAHDFYRIETANHPKLDNRW
ncbi:MAG TPA: GNAT family N-acetyltransferase [Cytophagales bacterium]|nr:GNAT family N-acetyltransferase [Cytophagales bacterium]